jgi:hypothetical protein
LTFIVKIEANMRGSLASSKRPVLVPIDRMLRPSQREIKPCCQRLGHWLLGSAEDSCQLRRKPRVLLREQGMSHAAPPSAPAPPDAVHVVVNREGHPVIDDVGNIFNVEAAAGDVSRDEEGPRAACEETQGSGAIALLHVACEER